MAGGSGSDAYPNKLDKLDGTLVRITAIGRLQRAPSGGEFMWRLDVPVDGVRTRNLWFRGDLTLLEAEQVAPAEWPPQPGDVWSDGTGQVWFFYLSEHDNSLSIRNATGGYVPDYPQEHLLHIGGLRLRHRLGPGEG